MRPLFCPYCGSENIHTADIDVDEHKTFCGDCGTSGPSSDTPNDAIASWNCLPRGPYKASPVKLSSWLTNLEDGYRRFTGHITAPYVTPVIEDLKLILGKSEHH